MKSQNQQPSKSQEGAAPAGQVRKHRFIGDYYQLHNQAHNSSAKPLETLPSCVQDDSVMEFERTEQEVLMSSHKQGQISSSNSQVEDPSSSMPTPLTFRQQHYDADTDSSQVQGLKAHVAALLPPMTSEDDQTMSLISDATIIFNNTESGVGHSGYDAGLLAAASSLFHQQLQRQIPQHSEMQSTTLNLEDLGGVTAMQVFQDITSSAQNIMGERDEREEGGPSQQNSSYMEQPSRCSSRLDSTQNQDLSMISSQLSKTMPSGISPTKAQLASKAKHEQRRQNLRKKRVQEQIMQVVEGFIREQTVLATVQGYVEANMLNDIMNAEHEIINKVIQSELRRIIRGILSDIYFAHISSLFIENFIQGELKTLGQGLIYEEERQNNSASLMILQESQDDYFQQTSAIQILDQEGECDDETLNHTDDQMIITCPTKQVIEIQQNYQSTGNLLQTSPSEELSIDVVSEGLRRQEMADIVLAELGENLIKQVLLGYTQESLAFHVISTTLTPTLTTHLYTTTLSHSLASLTSTLQDTLLSKLQAARATQLLAFEAARYAREQACLRELLVGEWVDRETTRVFKAEVEGEYFTRLIYEEVLGMLVEEVAADGYEDEIVADQMVSEMIDRDIEEVAVCTLNQEQQKAELVKDFQSSIVDTQVKESSIDIVLDLILDDFLQVFAQTTLSSKSLDDHLLIEDLYSDLVSSVLIQEVGFILQLEKDAEAIFQALVSSQIEEPSIESVTLSKKEEEVQTDALQEVFIVSQLEEVSNLKILRQTSSEETKRQNDRYGKRPIVPAKTPTHAMISLRDSVEVEDVWAKEYCKNLIEGGVRTFIQDILISLVLPHQIYKRIMTRTLRKTTYAAIQQAVDIAYKLEEDTINVADSLLDRFVESQIREMVMLYPTAKNYQRRSHTILIDASNDKFRIVKSPQAPTQYETEGRSRGRNTGGSQILTQASLFNQKRHSIEMNQSQEGFVNNIDAKYSSHQTQNSIAKQNIENQPVMMKKYNQTMPNQRYNNQNIHKQASSLGTTSQPFMEEELPSTTLHMIDVLPSVHFTHHLTHEDISFQQVADHACISGPAKQAILPTQLQAAYKTQSTSSAGIYSTLDQNPKSVSSSQDTRIADPAHFRSLRGLEKKRRSLEKHKSSLQSSEGGLMEPVEDVEIPAGHLGKLISPRISEQLLSSNRGNDSKRAPKEGFKFIETKNSMLAASQRSQEQLQIYPQLIMNTMDTRNANPLTMLTTSNVVYKPQVNQFDTFSSGSPGHGGLVNRNIPHVSLTLVGNQLQGTGQNSQRKSVNGIVQARSPQNHGRYFNDQSEVKSIKPQKDEPRGRSTSNRRAVIDLRGAIAQIQTAQKAIQPLIDPDGRKQLFTQTKRHQVDLRDSKSFVQNQNQRPSSAFGPATSIVKTAPQTQPLQAQHLSHHTPIITETSIKTQLQQLIMILKGRVTDCKAKTVQQSNHLTTGGPSTTLLMTQLACDVLHSLAEQVLSVSPQRDPLIDLRELNLEDSSINKTVTARIREEEEFEEPLSEQAKCREQLFVIDKKIKELVMKLQQNQSLMSKQDFQLCMLQANQLAMLNCQKLTLIMRDIEENNTQSFESINFPSHAQVQQHAYPSHTTKQAKGKQNIQPASSIHGMSKNQAQKQHQNRSTTSVMTGGSGVSTPNVSSFLKSHANQQQPLQMRQLNYNYAQMPQQRR